VSLSREPGDLVLRLTGTVPEGGPPTIVRAAIDNPTLYTARALKQALVARGIQVDGDAVDIDDVPGNVAPAQSPLVIHHSIPLREFALPLMKVSQNLYAETLLRSLGAGDAPATVAAARSVLSGVLRDWQVDPAGVVVADGSGLSRYNLVSADTLMAVLRRMYLDAQHREDWLRVFPVAGLDGTLEKRMKGTPAEGNARAKTGSLTRVRALSGYVRGSRGEQLAFVVIVNNAIGTAKSVEDAIDAIVVRLAQFER
jgi:D-alanyl-D-alanine carboxypeptidase/D-alanyl-D-alanine-endopeptidase (penicillin-binding protein 4)